MLICLVVELGVGKSLQSNKKLERLKKCCLKVKKYTEILQQKESIQKKIIRKVTNNLNSTATAKYGYPPEEVK